GAVVVLIARRVIRIEEHVSHARGPGRLEPDHRFPRFHFAPAARETGPVDPQVTAAIRDFLDHEAPGALHRRLLVGPRYRTAVLRVRRHQEHAANGGNHQPRTCSKPRLRTYARHRHPPARMASFRP